MRITQHEQSRLREVFAEDVDIVEVVVVGHGESLQL